MRFRNPIARWRQRRLLHDLRPPLAAVEAYLAGGERRRAAVGGPVVFFNASTRIHTLSLNAAFGLLASWSVRSAGHDVRYLVCHAGMTPCVLGTDRDAPETPPPCVPCLELSHALFPASKTLGLELDPIRAARLRRELEGRPLEALVAWEYSGLPLGRLTVPSLRWILRRQRLSDTTPVRSVMAGYLASAASLSEAVRSHLSTVKPRALVVFNGIFYPEAVARLVAEGLGIPVVTHEVGLRPYTAFFSHREATFRDVDVPRDVLLTAEQQSELDEVLSRRFRGDFTMAGIRFWPAMEGLPARLLEKRSGYRQMVAVFTNVIFDTSQVHANVLFDDMFAWLDDLAETIRQHPETLFVLRAHPDETRRGKESQETVAGWAAESGVDRLQNVVFIGPDEPVSSYDLIKASKFVLVYNSSVGLEASILGTAALCAGRARFTQIQATYAPGTRIEYARRLAEFLAAERVPVPEVQTATARAFLYYELFRASLDLSEFLVPDPRLPGMVRFSSFAPSRLAESDVLGVLRRGILDGEPFLASPTPSAPMGAVLEPPTGSQTWKTGDRTRGDA